jgi:hypothetical protein
MQMLGRIRAGALLDLGDVSAAAAEVELGLAASGGADGGYERAQLLMIAARLAEQRGQEGEALRADAARVLQALGVVTYVDDHAPTYS